MTILRDELIGNIETTVNRYKCLQADYIVDSILTEFTVGEKSKNRRELIANVDQTIESRVFLNASNIADGILEEFVLMKYKEK